MSTIEEIRIDKWLKIARFFKQREKAAEAVESGRVRINGERTKPAKPVRIDDELTIKINTKYRKFKVKKIAERSLPAAEAKELYMEVSANEPSKEMTELAKLIEEQNSLIPEQEQQKGRPTKKDRRILNKYKYMIK